MSVSDLYSYEKDGVVVRPVAADYMKKELEACLEEEKNDEYEALVNRGVVYEIKEEAKLSDKETRKLRRRHDIDNLRKFLEGNYVFEEGELLTAFDEVDFDRMCVCVRVYRYIQTLEDYDHVFVNWSLDDAGVWALDIADYHFGVLNAAEIFAVVNMMLDDMCRRNCF
jgi:hypothetical protein